MINYVIGLLFNAQGTEVLLIEKKRPEKQYDKYNGPGGHVEEGETPLDALVREFEEETGVCVPAVFWRHTVTLVESEGAYQVAVFAAQSTVHMEQAREISVDGRWPTDEAFYTFGIDELPHTWLVPGVAWIIHMSLPSSGVVWPVEVPVAPG